jgi:prepilin-type processing-associated H-X9-DG protein
MNRSNQEQHAAAGFSQLDLLTVIVVLLFLVLLLTPALARTRVTDQALQCRDNLRQLMLGWRMFAEDNSNSLPNCFDWVGAGWLDYRINNPDNTNVNYMVNGNLGPYVKNPVVYKCAADQSQAVVGTVIRPRVRTFSMSQAFCPQDEGHLEDSRTNYWRHYLTSADLVVPAPAKLWVMLDENPDSVNDGAFGVRIDPYGVVWQDGPTTLHDGSCGFAFADGHVEMKKWTDARTLALQVTYAQPFFYGMPQAHNKDIMWVQDRTTAPK